MGKEFIMMANLRRMVRYYARGEANAQSFEG